MYQGTGSREIMPRAQGMHPSRPRRPPAGRPVATGRGIPAIAGISLQGRQQVRLLVARQVAQTAAGCLEPRQGEQRVAPLARRGSAGGDQRLGDAVRVASATSGSAGP